MFCNRYVTSRLIGYSKNYQPCVFLHRQGCNTEDFFKSYIVRIYRYEKDNPAGMLAGIVESPEDGERKPFTTFDELWAALNQKEKEVACRKKSKKDNSGKKSAREGRKNHRAKSKDLRR